MSSEQGIPISARGRDGQHESGRHSGRYSAVRPRPHWLGDVLDEPPSEQVLIVGIKTLVTMTGEDGGSAGPLLGKALGTSLGLVTDAAILVRNRTVVACGREATVRRRAGREFAGRCIDLQGAMVTPGLVDCHTHPVFVGNRAAEFEMRLRGETYESIMAAGGGIANSVRRLWAASDAEIAAELRLHLGWLRRHGVVAAECKSGYGLVTEHELRSLRAIRDAQGWNGMRLVPTCLAAHTLPPEWAGDRDEFVTQVCEETIPAVALEELAHAVDVFVEKGAFTGDQAARIVRAAQSVGLTAHIHADQLGAGDGSKVAVDTEAASADHLEYVTDDTIARMAEKRVTAVLLPGSTFCLRQARWAPGRKLVDAGVPVALSTDFNPGSSPVPNPAFVMNLACLHLGLTPAEALAAFTRNAAYCIGIDGEYGAIAPGMRAAFAVWEVGNVSEIAYWAGGNLVREVVIV